MENIVDIYNLLPEEINEAIKRLTDALGIVKLRKNTNSKFVEKEILNYECHHCHSIYIIKNGHDKNKVQTYKCKTVKRNLIHVPIH